MPVDYHVWKGMPKRDPAERIARYGQGFSKIVSNMRGGEFFAASRQQPNRSNIVEGLRRSVDDSYLQ